MRIDKFLQITGILKSRTVAKEACEKGYVYINGLRVKASREINKGDEVVLDFPLRRIKFVVLEIPEKKNISKKERESYFKILEDERKDIL